VSISPDVVLQIVLGMTFLRFLTLAQAPSFVSDAILPFSFVDLISF
jgi:hypothetical protein